MRSTNLPNINFRSYWNNVYGDELKRAGYESQGTDTGIQVGSLISREHHTERFNRAVAEVKKGDKVLDIGCGIGAFTRRAKQITSEVWGVDISDAVIEANKREHKGIRYSQGYVGQLDMPEDYFDVVFAGEILEHLDDPSVLIKEAYKFLRKGGKLVLTTPLEEAIKSGEHVWFFTKEDVEKLFTDAGFSCEFVDLPDLEYAIVIFAIGIKK